MSGQARTAEVAALAGLALAGLIGPTTAHAGQFSLMSVQSSSAGVSAEGAEAAASASCPQTTRPVSGGFDTTLTDSHGPVVVDTSAADRNTWQVAGNEYGCGSDSISALASCARGAPPETAVTATTTVDVDSPPTGVTAQCPNNSEAIAGGFITTYDGAARAGNIVYESRRSGDDAWRVSAVHTFTGDPTGLTAVAYCGHAPKLLTQFHVVQVAAGPDPVRSDATCPAGTSAVSGGFKSSVEVGQFTVMAFPAASRPGGLDTWSASGVYPGLGGPFDFTTYAYCAAAR
jgi:hypothetical protein